MVCQNFLLKCNLRMVFTWFWSISFLETFKNSFPKWFLEWHAQLLSVSEAALRPFTTKHSETLCGLSLSSSLGETEHFSSCYWFTEILLRLSHRNFLGDSIHSCIGPCFSGSEDQRIISKHISLSDVSVHLHWDVINAGVFRFLQAWQYQGVIILPGTWNMELQFLLGFTGDGKIARKDGHWYTGVGRLASKEQTILPKLCCCFCNTCHSRWWFSAKI